MNRGVTEALHEALALADLASELTGCRGDDDYVNGVREKIKAALGLLATEPGAAEGEWQPIETAPKDQEVLLAYWRWRNSMSPGSIVVQSASLTEHHGDGIWSWVVYDNKHGPFPIRGWSEGDLLGWRPLPAAPHQSGESGNG